MNSLQKVLLLAIVAASSNVFQPVFCAANRWGRHEDAIRIALYHLPQPDTLELMGFKTFYVLRYTSGRDFTDRLRAELWDVAALVRIKEDRKRAVDVNTAHRVSLKDVEPLTVLTQEDAIGIIDARGTLWVEDGGSDTVFRLPYETNSTVASLKQRLLGLPRPFVAQRVVHKDKELADDDPLTDDHKDPFNRIKVHSAPILAPVEESSQTEAIVKP